MTDPVIAVFAEVLGVDPAQINDETAPANTPDWDSVANISLITELEARFGIELSTSDIASMNSVGRVREVLQALQVPDLSRVH